MGLFRRKPKDPIIPELPEIERPESRTLQDADCNQVTTETSVGQGTVPTQESKQVVEPTINETHDVNENINEEEYVAPQVVKDFISQFESGMYALHKKWIKTNYNIMKGRLYQLNVELDECDTECKNELDKEKYDKLGDLEQTYFLIEDIFDNYRPIEFTQIYTQSQNERINQVLVDINSLTGLGWFEELLKGIGVL